MKAKTLNWSNLLAIALLAVVIIVSILAMTLLAQDALVSFGWFGAASVGWVT